MKGKGYHELGFAKLDTNRTKRRGFPEVVYAPGKTDQQILEISRGLISHGETLLITRIKVESYLYLKNTFSRLKYNSKANIAYLSRVTACRAPTKKKGMAL